MLRQSYIFGGNTKETAVSVARKREIAKAMLDKTFGNTPKTAAEGIGAIGNAIIGRIASKRADKAETELVNSDISAIQKLLGQTTEGGNSNYSPFAPRENQANHPSLVKPINPGQGGEFSSFNAALAQSESGGRSDIRNSEGFSGKFQFGQERLNDFNRANGTSFTTDQLQKNPQLQDTVQNWHVADIDSFVAENGLDQFVGQNFRGTQLSHDSLRAVAHLGGKQGLQNFLTSGGQYNPSDSNGTSLLDYATRFSGQSAPEQAINTQTQSTQSLPGISTGQPQARSILLPQQRPQQSQSAFNAFLPRRVNEAGITTQQAGADRSGSAAEPQALTNATSRQVQQQVSQGGVAIQPRQQIVNEVANPNRIDVLSNALNNPFLPDGYKQVAQAMLQQELGNLFPERLGQIDQARLDHLKAQTEKLRNPLKHRPLTAAEEQQYELDTTKQYNLAPDGRISQIGGGGVNVNVGAGESAFTKEAAKLQAKNFAEFSTQGESAQEDLAVFGELEQALDSIGSGGLLTSLRGQLAGLGIDVEGKSDFDVASTLIDRLTPRQRVPGSGATSDFEARLFRNSLPSLLKSPEGNRIVLQTYKSLAENARERGRIADAALAGTIKRDEALKQLRALPDPQERLKAYKAGKPFTEGPPIGTVEGEYRFKGGNASNPKNWEKVQ